MAWELTPAGRREAERAVRSRLWLQAKSKWERKVDAESKDNLRFPCGGPWFNPLYDCSIIRVGLKDPEDEDGHARYFVMFANDPRVRRIAIASGWDHHHEPEKNHINHLGEPWTEIEMHSVSTDDPAKAAAFLNVAGVLIHTSAAYYFRRAGFTDVYGDVSFKLPDGYYSLDRSPEHMFAIERRTKRIVKQVASWNPTERDQEVAWQAIRFLADNGKGKHGSGSFLTPRMAWFPWNRGDRNLILALANAEPEDRDAGANAWAIRIAHDYRSDLPSELRLRRDLRAEVPDDDMSEIKTSEDYEDEKYETA